jgi:hypothetical protein
MREGRANIGSQLHGAKRNSGSAPSRVDVNRRHRTDERYQARLFVRPVVVLLRCYIWLSARSQERNPLSMLTIQQRTRTEGHLPVFVDAAH